MSVIRTEPETHQAVCDACGWHTVPMTQRERIEALAKKHEEDCPRYVARNGALFACGCWSYDVPPGGRLGLVRECPEHGPTTAEKMNVAARRPDPGTRWVVPWKGEEE